MTTVVGDASIRVVIDDEQARRQVDEARRGRDEGGDQGQPPPERVTPTPAPGGPNPNAEVRDGKRRTRPGSQPEPESPGDPEADGVSEGDADARRRMRKRGRSPTPDAESVLASQSTIRDIFSSRSPSAAVNAGARGFFPGIVRALAPVATAGAVVVGGALAAERFGPSLQGIAAGLGSVGSDGDFLGGVADVIGEVGVGVTDFRNTLASISQGIRQTLDLAAFAELSDAGAGEIEENDAITIGTKFQRVGKAQLDLQAAVRRVRDRARAGSATRLLMEGTPGSVIELHRQAIDAFLIDTARRHGGR